MEASTQTPQPLTTTLVMSPEQYQRVQRESRALELANAFTIDAATPLEEQGVIAKEANDELRAVKVRLAEVKTLREGFIAPALTIVENAKALFNPAIEALEGAETFLKTQLIGYKERCDKAEAEAKRKAEEEARIAREKAAREAAAARARAEEEAKAKERAAAEAEAARKKAEEEGNAKAAKKAAEQAAKAQADAEAARRAGEAKANQAELEAAAAQREPERVERATLGGFSTRKTWSAELAPNTSEDDAIAEIVEAIAGVKMGHFPRADLLALLCLNMKKANALAKAQESKMNVPGLVAKPTTTGAASRSK